jgi:hypothetical protein
LRIAGCRIGRIALWALIAATVGIFLSTVRQRSNWILRLLGASLGLAWTLLTHLIVPVLLFEDRGVYYSIYRAEELYQGNWGVQGAGDFGFGLLGLLLSLLLSYWCFSSAPTPGPWPSSWHLLILSVVCSAMKGVVSVALYRYATQRQAPPGFSADLIEEAFRALSLLKTPTLRSGLRLHYWV